MWRFGRKRHAVPPVEAILVARSAIESEDPYALTAGVVDFVNYLIGPGKYYRDDLPIEAAWCHHVDYYLMEVTNGGHGQFAAHSSWREQTRADIRDGLTAMGLIEAAAIFAELERFAETEPTRFAAVRAAGGFGDRDPVIDLLDDRFHAGPSRAISSASAAWLRTLPVLESVPDSEIAARLALLVTANPLREMRQAEVERQNREADARDPLVQAFIYLLGESRPPLTYRCWRSGHAARNDAGASGRVFVIVTDQGLAHVTFLPDRAALFAPAADQPCVLLSLTELDRIVTRRTGQPVSRSARSSLCRPGNDALTIRPYPLAAMWNWLGRIGTAGALLLLVTSCVAPAPPRHAAIRPLVKDARALVQALAPAADAQALAALPTLGIGGVATPDAAPAFALPITASDDADRARECLAAAVYYEAASEPIEGQRAVAQVVLNRVRSRAFPHSVCGVVYQGVGSGRGCQFSFACDGSTDRPRSPTAWSIAERVALAALNGSVMAEVGDATFYHANYVMPWWASSLTRLGAIGRHIFYRWPTALEKTLGLTAAYAGMEPGVPTIAGATRVAGDAGVTIHRGGMTPAEAPPAQTWAGPVAEARHVSVFSAGVRIHHGEDGPVIADVADGM